MLVDAARKLTLHVIHNIFYEKALALVFSCGLLLSFG